ncbi:RadC family protein [Evansella cellulosilytica]|uniref:DNA repair protein RadC n=1 Tax=Evansella cellulosilytica (strain ATCC 21833 / DSM 2522 / FERM P-1141 / JCM 9156 / N-4) TaxID=649639 RepID=E6TZM8_EVAC2|nr:DNA repair protein RadC [Evansella cellulosilytica]ADU31334.1 DNA repair protein RadC [Evansella cellulosilytica DSM 2522]
MNVMLIRDVPKSERPRERMMREGAQTLSNQDLIAVLLGSGTKSESVLQLAGRVIQHFDGLKLLKEASIPELQNIKGIGEAKAVTIKAAMELGKRIQQFSVIDRYTIRSPEDAANYMMEEMRHLTQEHFVALYLNTKNHVMHKQTIFIGSLNASIVHPRELFKEAFRYSAASIVFAHIGMKFLGRNNNLLCF